MANTLIVGAASAIARALAKQISERDSGSQLVCISSKATPSGLPENVRWRRLEYNETDIDAVVNELQQQGLRFGRIFICNGQLHNHEIQPEKKLEDLQLQNLRAIFNANTFIPVLCLSRLQPLLDCKRTTITLFSARVGSISDNQLGGWYSYRASKAALNMLVKTASVELKRRSKNSVLISFHPGTADTPLSRPFQKNLPSGQLRTAAQVAEGLLTLCENLTPADTGKFFDWKGEELQWRAMTY